LTVLAHDDERALQGHEDGQDEVIEDVRVRIEPCHFPVVAWSSEADVRGDDRHVDDAPGDRQTQKHEDERPAAVELGHLVREALAPG